MANESGISSADSSRGRLQSADIGHPKYLDYLNHIEDIPPHEREALQWELMDSIQSSTLNSGNEDVIADKPGNFALECLGCLANLSLPDLDFSRILSELQLLDWVKRELSKSVSEKKRRRKSSDDIVENASTLELVRLIGTMCIDREAARLVVENKLIDRLLELLNEAPAYLIDLMHDKNAEIRRLCEISLDIISEFNANWRTRIQAERFRWHNSQWLEMIDSATNPIVIENDPTTEAVMAAALASGHARARYRCAIAGRKKHGDDNDEDSDEDHDGSEELSDSDGDGPFGMGLDIDDAAALLRTLPSSSGLGLGTIDSENSLGLTSEDLNYLNNLELMYPELYNDPKMFAHRTSSSIFHNKTPGLSDSDSLETTLQ